MLSKIRKGIVRCIKSYPNVVNFFPFNNKIHLPGTDFQCEGILKHCVVKCSGQRNQIIIDRGRLSEN